MCRTISAPDYQRSKHSNQFSAAHFKAVFLKGKKEYKVPWEIRFISPLHLSVMWRFSGKNKVLQLVLTILLHDCSTT